MIRSSAPACAIAAFTLATGAALAADLPSQTTYSKAPVTYQAPASWSGCYLGGNIGAGSDSTYDLGTGFAGTAFVPPIVYGTSNGSNFIGGAQLGCDNQFATNWVIGVQGSAEFGSINSMNPVLAFPGITAAYQLKNTGDVTARLGYVITPTLLAYAKGGVGWANASVSALALSVLAESANFTRAGYTVGGGVEWKFASNWSVFAEYDFLDFGTKTGTLYSAGLVPTFGAAGAASDSVSLRLRSQEALVGINYRFNWANPVVAKY